MTSSPLYAVIASEIDQLGAMPIDRYMALCLTHSKYGYYTQSNPIGGEGDFITAPEVSQIFGEVCAAWLIDVAQQQDLKGWALAELGPGKGTLMADMLRVMPFPQPHIHLVEINPQLRALQEEKLTPIANHPITWHESIATLPQEPLLIIANEFFDAMPIKQFTAHNGRWHEMKVIVKGNKLALERDQDLAKPQPKIALAEEGSIAEISSIAQKTITSLARHVNRYGGAALIIDYGKTSPLGDSIQGVRKHRSHSILENPGKTDISALVDFEALKNAAQSAKAKVSGHITQGEFLKAIGLNVRAEKLAEGADAATKRNLLAAVDRLTSPQHMGEIFKVLVILPQGADFAVAGF